MKRGRRPIPPGAPGHPRGKGPDHGGPGGARRPAAGSERAGAPGGHGRRLAARLAYEDDLILAYDKPAGLPVIAPDGSRAPCLLDIATERVRRRNPKGRAAVVHRIDRDTSGIVVFARNAGTKRVMMSGWDEIVTERRYVALVEGRMEAEEGVLDSYLIEGEKLFVRTARPGEKGAKRAISRWRVLSEGAGSSLVEIFLETGRKHQIRVQFAGVGHPVVGDPRYGRSGGGGERARGGDRGTERLFLHAAAIELRLPERAESLRIESPVPPEFYAALRGRPEPTADSRRATADSRRATADSRRATADSRRATADGGRPQPRGGRAAPRAAPFNAPRGGASASRREDRSGAPRAPAARRGKKPSSRP